MTAVAIDPRQGVLDFGTALRPPRICDVCAETVHLLGTDSLRGVSQRLGFKEPEYLRVHLRRHGRIELAARYDALEGSNIR